MAKRMGSRTNPSILLGEPVATRAQTEDPGKPARNITTPSGWRRHGETLQTVSEFRYDQRDTSLEADCTHGMEHGYGIIKFTATLRLAIQVTSATSATSAILVTVPTVALQPTAPAIPPSLIDPALLSIDSSS